MSDIAPFKSFLGWKLSIETPSLAYAAKAVTRNVLFAVEIPYPLLKAWHGFLKADRNEKPSSLNQGPSTSADLGESATKLTYTYTDLLEFSVPGNCFAISDDLAVREEIRQSLQKLAGAVTSEYEKTPKGRKKQALKTKSKRFHIFEGQTISVAEFKREIDLTKDELEEWKQKHNNLEMELKRLYEEMQVAINGKDKTIEHLQSKNQELIDYVRLLEKNENISYKGKDISGTKKKSRTLKSFSSRAQTALWFAKSYGLELKSIIVAETKTGATHTVTPQAQGQVGAASSADEQTRLQQTGFDTLSEDEKGNVEKILFLLDKFCVGDCFYHELTMVTDGLPKSYLVKQRRDQLNNICHVTRTPGTAEGAQMSFNDLLKERIKDHLVSHPDDHDQPIKVKISGDGARMTRNSSFILLSFALLQAGDDVMAAKGNHTIAVVKGKEDYETLQSSFADVFHAINTLIDNKQILVDGKEIDLEFFLWGDYKFILLMMGLKGATSHYACVWCKVYKDDRWKMHFDLNHYQSTELKRTLKEMNELSENKKAKEKYCCEHKPLLNIELAHVILDELHLLLRVLDVLIENLIRDALQWDQKDNFNKKRGDQKNKHLNDLQKTKSCGISFEIWEKKNADGKGSGQYDFTSLLGSDKKKLLKNLPSKLPDVIQKETASTVQKIWETFDEIYAIVTSKTPSEEDMGSYFEKAKGWVNLFTSLRDKRIGYKRANITPYMHAMVYHIPKFFEAHKSVKVFTGQGVEKNNDMARSIVLHKSNKWDAATDVLRLESRQWELRDSERSKRPYSKKNTTYWEKELGEARRNKRHKSN